MPTDREKLEAKYNKLLAEREKVREEIIEVKRDLDRAIESDLAKDIMSSSGLEVVNGEVRLSTLSQQSEVLPGRQEAKADEDEEDDGA